MIREHGKLLPEDSFADFSEDRKYRYRLFRNLATDVRTPRKLKKIVWCMLNPSTADAFKLDPTLKKCVQFSKNLGYHHFTVVNVFALRSTDPKGLYTVSDPVGRDNLNVIQEVCNSADMIICGWGKEKIVQQYHIKDELKNYKTYALEINKDGTPKHPLYISYTKAPIIYNDTFL